RGDLLHEENSQGPPQEPPSLPLAEKYATAENPERAAYYLEAALETAPDSADLHVEYARLLANYGKIDAAKKQLNSALTIDPQHAAGRETLKVLLKWERNRR
ncbi:MAG: tetratricopeptide repeat protein, partial [Planctomycetota bacterium]